jgi:hypothetical protein
VDDGLSVLPSEDDGAGDPGPDPVLVKAEEMLGRVVADVDRQALRKMRVVDKFPDAWILEAMDEPAARKIRKMAYVGGILHGYREQNGPPSEKPSRVAPYDKARREAEDAVFSGPAYREAKEPYG